MNARLRLNLLLQVVSVILVSFMLSCSGGGSSTPPDGNGVAPQIFGLDKSSANIGDTVLVIGNNFGTSQGTGTVALNGIGFQVNSWTDTQISATVVGGMSSGIVVVNQDGLDSQSGQQAQLFIGSAPSGSPVIYALSPDYGRKGEDEVLITGVNFGSYSEADDTGVFFTADAAVSAIGYVKAQVVVNPSTSLPEWTASSIRVIVPSNAKTGDLYVSVAGQASNHRAFEAQPPAGPSGAPVITSFSPGSGPIGTQVTLLGTNFGNQQGNSTLKIGGVSLDVLDWTNTQILANIPAGATSGSFNIAVGGNSAVSGSTFIVANTPVITGATPTSMHVGQSLTLYGNFFGFIQGAGTVKVGNTTVAADSWSDTVITINSLPGISTADPENVPIIVTSDASLSSLPFPAKLVSDISGLVTVKPKAGVAGKTNFKFSISAAGGSGNYEYTLIPNTSDPATSKTASNPITYQYASKGTYSTQVRVKDNVSGDIALIDGPDVTVVGPDDMVITAIEMVDFGTAQPVENEWTAVPNPQGTGMLNSDFVFFQNQVWFTSSLADLFSGNTKLPAFERDQAGFAAGSAAPRPYAYRHISGLGSKVRIHGFNFGVSQGNIWLNSSGVGNGTQVASGNIAGWGLPGNSEDQDELIEFVLDSAVGAHLGGYVVVERTDVGKSVKSIDPMLCSAYVTDIQPPTVAANATLQISAYDLTAPVLENVSGSSTKLFWIVKASYTDPFTNAATTKDVMVVHPYDVTVTNGNLISFNMADLGPTVDIEAPNADYSDYQVVLGATLVTPADYHFFIWTGADTSNGSNILKANSGLMSDVYDIAVTAGGGGGNQAPNAVLAGNPTSGNSPLDVTFNASASSDPDGSITKFEFNFDDGAGFIDNGTTATIQHTFIGNNGDVFNVQVRVTDDGAPGLTDTASVPISIGGGGGGNWTINGRVGDLFQAPPISSDPWDSANPLAGIVVGAWDSNDTPGVDPPVATGTSDASGSFAITGVPTLGGCIVQPLLNPAPSGDNWFPPQAIFFPLDMDVPPPGAGNNANGQGGPTILDEHNFV